MPFDISLLPEKELRPWAECKETDDLVEQELRNVNDILALTSPIKNAGFQGMSELDMKSDQLLEFHSMVAQPGWMGFDEPEVTDVVVDEEFPPQDDTAPRLAQTLVDDPQIMDALNKLNSLTSAMKRNKLARLRTMHLLPIDTMRGV